MMFMQTAWFLLFEWKMIMKNSWLIKSIDTGYCTAETCVYIFCPLGDTSSLCMTENVLLCRAGKIDACVKWWKWAAKRGTACIPQPWSLCTQTAIKPWSQISEGEEGRWVSCLQLCLLCCPGQTKAFPMSGWFTHSRIIFWAVLVTDSSLELQYPHSTVHNNEHLGGDQLKKCQKHSPILLEVKGAQGQDRDGKKEKCCHFCQSPGVCVPREALASL